jgi:hypothetical protein
MRTPYDKECPYFFGDYYRGRNHEVCRLVEASGDLQQWTSKLCKNCPVPSIIQANACTNMTLQGKVGKVVFGLGKHMQITAYCKKTNKKVKEPHIGCGECHPLPEIFMEDK